MLEPDFEKGKGLIPAIVQDSLTGEVLMVAYMNREAWLKTLETGKATYWSRSRNSLWIKGETSGHFQVVKEILVDCDEDTVLLKVQQTGGGLSYGIPILFLSESDRWICGNCRGATRKSGGCL